MESAHVLEPEAQPQGRPAHRWTIRRIMLVTAMLAPLLALTRYPFAFGLMAYLGTVASIVGLSLWWRRYGPLAWLLIFYPALPLLVLYVQESLASRRIVGRGSPLFEGLIGVSDVCGIACLFAYVGCVSILARDVGRDRPGLRKAAWRVVILLPIAWVGLFVFAVWDPFRMLARLFR